MYKTYREKRGKKTLGTSSCVLCIEVVLNWRVCYRIFSVHGVAASAFPTCRLESTWKTTQAHIAHLCP
jgi:hypothetical protein